MIYLFFLIAYAAVPPCILFYTLKLIYKNRNAYGWHLQYLAKFFITLSFLPLLYFSDLELGLKPQSWISLVTLLITVVSTVAFIPAAMKNKVMFFYSGGVMASFMEEILYRGVLFGLVNAIWGNTWVTIALTSFLFGVWHLKNYHWAGKKIRVQFFYTAFLYGPIFCFLRILTGDIYLAVLFHYITDTMVALAPDWMRGWLVFGGRGKNDKDNF